jgi:hypothetical protein
MAENYTIQSPTQIYEKSGNGHSQYLANPSSRKANRASNLVKKFKCTSAPHKLLGMHDGMINLATRW